MKRWKNLVHSLFMVYERSLLKNAIRRINPSKSSVRRFCRPESQRDLRSINPADKISWIYQLALSPDDKNQDFYHQVCYNRPVNDEK